MSITVETSRSTEHRDGFAYMTHYTIPYLRTAVNLCMENTIKANICIIKFCYLPKDLKFFCAADNDLMYLPYLLCNATYSLVKLITSCTDLGFVWREG